MGLKTKNLQHQNPDKSIQAKAKKEKNLIAITAEDFKTRCSQKQRFGPFDHFRRRFPDWGIFQFISAKRLPEKKIKIRILMGIKKKFIDDVNKLGPFGNFNFMPIFLIRNLRIKFR